MNQQPLFTCSCRNQYTLDEATMLGMKCPACGSNLRRMDSIWAVSEIADLPSSPVISWNGQDKKVAIITLPSKNENDVESVSDLIRSLPMPISLEIFARGNRRYFLIRGRKENLEFAAERLESVYPKLQVTITDTDPVQDCFSEVSGSPIGGWAKLNKPGWLPIKTWESFLKGGDPVIRMMSSFSGLSENEAVWMQLFLAKEGSPEWEQKVQKRLKVESQRGYMVDESASMVSSPIEVRQLEALNFRAVGIFTAAALGLGMALMLFISGFMIWAGFLTLLIIAGGIFLLELMNRLGQDEWDQTDLSLVREKMINSQRLVKSSLRFMAISDQPERSLSLLRRIGSTLHQYSVSGGNSFSTTDPSTIEQHPVWPETVLAQEEAPVLWISPLEIAGLWHPPLFDHRANMDAVKVNSIAMRAPSPDDVQGLYPIGDTRLPGGKEFEVFLNAQAMRRGITMVGKPGMGKSILMEHIVKISAEEDPEKPAIVVVDPHGDLAERLLGVLSPEVVRDRVYYLDVAAKDYIMTYNPLDPHQEGLDPQAIAQIFMDIGQALFGKYWGPRMQIPYKRTILTVAMANKKRGPGRMFGPNLITPFLMADKELWAEFIKQEIGDDEEMVEILNMYYQGQLAHINHHLKQQVIMPVLSKSDRFAEEPANSLYNPPKSDLDLWEIIKNRKILIINTRSGIIGEDMSAFTGALFINAVVKIVMHQIANRVKERIPITFVIDEMQTIAGVRWDTILGQMRKHGFNLVIGTQSLASIRENLGDNMPGIILGGSHTLFTFRINGEDAEKLSEEEFRTEEGGVDPTTLTQLPPYHVWASMVGENGDKIPPFSMRIKPPLDAPEEQIQEALLARANYSTPFREASAAGMASLTYIRDSFGRVLSEGTGGPAAPASVDISARASRSGNKTYKSLLNDPPPAGDDHDDDNDDHNNKMFRDLEGDAATLFAEDDFV